MRKIFKAIILLVALPFFGTVMYSLFSCKNDSDTEIRNTGKEYLLGLRGELSHFFDSDVSFSSIESSTHTTRGVSISDTVKLVAVLPGNTLFTNDFFKDREVQVREIANLVKELDAKLYMEGKDAEDTIHVPLQYQKVTINVSEAKVIASLKELTSSSREFLNERGMSESDIEEMLHEENADETALVPLTLAMAEAEENSSNTNYSHADITPFGFFVAPAFAEVTTSGVFNCAMNALGADILLSLGQSSAKKWSKAVIKRVFKSVAYKAIGPVGATIAIIEFGLCINAL